MAFLDNNGISHAEAHLFCIRCKYHRTEGKYTCPGLNSGGCEFDSSVFVAGRCAPARRAASPIKPSFSARRLTALACLPHTQTNDIVLVDELQDSIGSSLALIDKSVKPDGEICGFGDFAQIAFAYQGVERQVVNAYPHIWSLESTLGDGPKIELWDNHRSGTLIVEQAQKHLDDIITWWPPSDDPNHGQIVAARTDPGLVADDATFVSHPFEFDKTILVLGRKAFDVLTMFRVCLGKGIKAKMHGLDTAKELVAMLDKLPALLSQSVAKLKLSLDRSMPRQGGSGTTGELATRELQQALLFFIQSYLQDHEALDSKLAAAKATVRAAIMTTFEDTKRAVPGVVYFSTIHSSKGLQSYSVYIINPGLCPLPDRVAKRHGPADWEAYEETCVAFIAVTRATDKLIYLQNLDSTSYESVDKLFAKPEVPAAAGLPHSEQYSQPESEAEPQPTQDDLPHLETLELPHVPATVQELDNATMQALKVPLNQLKTAEYQAKKQKVLGAREYLVKYFPDVM